MIRMSHLIMKKKGRVRGFIEAWRLIINRAVEGRRLHYGKKVLGVAVKDVVESSVKTVEASSSYSSIPVVSSSRYVDLYRYVRNWVSIKRLTYEYRIPRSLTTASVLSGVAQGYLLATRTNRLGIARTFTGDYLINHGLFQQEDIVDLALAYLIPSLYVPSRTQIMYMLMKSVNSTDPEVIANALRSMLFTGTLIGVEKLALTTYLELEETGFFEKYSGKRVLYTPTYFAYVFAQLLDKLMDFSTFRRTYVYVAGRRGLATISAFKNLFEKIIVDEHVLEELVAKPKGDFIRKVLEMLAGEYDEIHREAVKITQL